MIRFYLSCYGQSTVIPSLKYKFYIGMFEKEQMILALDNDSCREFIKNCQLTEVRDNPMLLRLKITNARDQVTLMAHFGWSPTHECVSNEEIYIRKSSALGTRKSFIYEPTFKYKIVGYVFAKVYNYNEEILNN